MKRSKSGAQKRKKAATARDAVAKLPKMTDFFKITEQSRPGTSTESTEIAQELDIDPSFPPSRSGKKRRLFDYQGEEEQRATPELKFKSNFFYPLVDQAIMSIKERFNLLREVSSAFSFLYTRDKLLLVQQENALLTCCKEFQKKFGDIDSDEMSADLQWFVLILQKKTQSQYGSRLCELSSKDSFI